MKVKKVGETPKPSVPEIDKEREVTQIIIPNIKRDDNARDHFDGNQIEKGDTSSNKLIYLIGGILLFLAAVVFIYFQYFNDINVKNQNTISSTNENKIQNEVTNEHQLKNKELEPPEQKLNPGIEKNNQTQNSNINTNIIDGYYQVGSVFCTIKTNNNGGTVRWDKGSGITTLVADVQGEDVLYMEYDSRGVECGYFYFYDGFHIGDYNRKDGKVFKVTKIR